MKTRRKHSATMLLSLNHPQYPRQGTTRFILVAVLEREDRRRVEYVTTVDRGHAAGGVPRFGEQEAIPHAHILRTNTLDQMPVGHRCSSR